MALVVISPNDPDAMARYADECRREGLRFLYDPSQQVARLSGEDLREGLSGASILIVNDYEFGILTQKTELSREELEAQVPVLVVTHGAEGSTVAVRDGVGRVTRHEIPAAKLESEAIDPTGVGDAYRAGLIRGMHLGAPWPVAARLGSVTAVFGLETLGPQPPRYAAAALRARYERSFGPEPILEKLRME